MSAIRPLFALVSLFALVPPDVRSQGTTPKQIAYAVSPGTKLDRSFALEHHLVVSKLALAVDGVTQSSQKKLGVTGRVSARVQDEVRSVAGGRPTLYSRAFLDGGVHLDLQSDEGTAARADTIDAKSLLSGTSVLFTWVPSQSTFGRCYDAREASEDFLRHIEGDFDVLALYPKDAVQVGAEWDVAAAEARSVFAPLGDLPLRFTKFSEALPPRAVSLGLAAQLADVLSGDVHGRIHAKVTAIEHDKVTLAIEYEIACERDQTELAQSYSSSHELVDRTRLTAAKMTWKSRGQGTLIFETALGAFSSVELTGSEDVRLDTAFSLRDGASKTEQTLELAGGLKVSLTTQRAKPKAATAPAGKGSDADGAKQDGTKSDDAPKPDPKKEDPKNDAPKKSAHS